MGRRSLSYTVVIAVLALATALGIGRLLSVDRPEETGNALQVGPYDGSAFGRPVVGDASKPPTGAGLPATGVGQRTESGLWDIFLAALQRRDFDTALPLAPAARIAELDHRVAAVDAVAGLELARKDAGRCGEILALLFLPPAGKPEEDAIRDRCVRVLGSAWESLETLSSARALAYATHVSGKPVSIPERHGLTDADAALIRLLARLDGASVSTLGALLDAMAGRGNAPGQFWEPVASGLISLQMETDAAKPRVRELASRYVANPSLSERFRWELRLLSASSDPVVHVLELLEREASLNGAYAIVRSSAGLGLIQSDAFLHVIPYLCSRYELSVALGLTHALVSSYSDKSQDDVCLLAGLASELLVTEVPGSPLACACVTVLQALDSRRGRFGSVLSKFEEQPELAGLPPLIPSGGSQAFRRALELHFKSIVSGLSVDRLSPNPPSAIALLAVEASQSLSDAVEALEGLRATSNRREELMGLRRGLDSALTRCHGRYSKELAENHALKIRLIGLSTSILQQPAYAGKPFPQDTTQSAISGVSLAFRIICIADAPAPVRVQAEAISAMRRISADYAAFLAGLENDRARRGYSRVTKMWESLNRRLDVLDSPQAAD